MKLKIINKKKFVKSIAITLGIIFAIMFALSNKSLSHENIKYGVIYVNQGDTLWSIAENQQKNNPYYAGKDVRYIISSIKRVNKLTDSYLFDGQKLLIANI